MIDQIPQGAGVWTVVAMVLGIVATILTRALTKRDRESKQRRAELDALDKEIDAAFRGEDGDDRQRNLDILRRCNRL